MCELHDFHNVSKVELVDMRPQNGHLIQTPARRAVIWQEGIAVEVTLADDGHTLRVLVTGGEQHPYTPTGSHRGFTSG